MFGFSIVLTLAAGAAALSINRLHIDQVWLSEPDRGKEIRIGDFDVVVHFPRNPDDLELHVMVVKDPDLDDALQTRIRLKNGQSYSLIVRDDEMDEEAPGDRVTFVRAQDAILVMYPLHNPGPGLQACSGRSAETAYSALSAHARLVV